MMWYLPRKKKSKNILKFKIKFLNIIQYKRAYTTCKNRAKKYLKNTIKDKN